LPLRRREETTAGEEKKPKNNQCRKIKQQGNLSVCSGSCSLWIVRQVETAGKVGRNRLWRNLTLDIKVLRSTGRLAYW